jgi:hypothetical protein
MTERRKADRAVMAGKVAALAAEHGLQAEVRPAEEPLTRATFVDLVGPHGLRLTVSFQGRSPHTQPDTYVLSWYGVEDGWRLSPDAFGDVNPYHGHKATDVARSFPHLRALLRDRFETIADGTAFVQAAGPAQPGRAP